MKRLSVAIVACALIGCGGPQAAAPTPTAGTPTGCDPTDADIRIARGPKDERRVALTFDDGPDRYTKPILDILKSKDARATFFVVGKFVRAQPALVKRALRDGHMIGNHTFTHATVEEADEAAAVEIDRTTDAIGSATGFVPCLFRAPSGKETRALYDMVRARGMTTIYSSVDPRDWDPKTTPDEIERDVLEDVEAGSIILLHDGYRNEATVEALPRVIDGLRSAGYELVTVTDLMDIPLVYD